jgi:hypothetical protein
MAKSLLIFLLSQSLMVLNFRLLFLDCRSSRSGEGSEPEGFGQRCADLAGDVRILPVACGVRGRTTTDGCKGLEVRQPTAASMQRWRRQRHPELIFWSREGISETRIRVVSCYIVMEDVMSETRRVSFFSYCVSLLPSLCSELSSPRC